MCLTKLIVKEKTPIIVRVLCYRHRKYQIIQVVSCRPTSILKHLALSYFQTPNENENTFFWCKVLVNKLAAPPCLTTLKGLQHSILNGRKRGGRRALDEYRTSTIGHRKMSVTFNKPIHINSF
jgi:hypothetical protein